MAICILMLEKSELAIIWPRSVANKPEAVAAITSSEASRTLPIDLVLGAPEIDEREPRTKCMRIYLREVWKSAVDLAHCSWLAGVRRIFRNSAYGEGIYAAVK